MGLIHATSLWSDELYTVGKSFQPDYGALLAMLLQDTHPACLILASVALGCSSWAKRSEFAAVVLACLWLGRCGDGVFSPASWLDPHP